MTSNAFKYCSRLRVPSPMRSMRSERSRHRLPAAVSAARARDRESSGCGSNRRDADANRSSGSASSSASGTAFMHTPGEFTRRVGVDSKLRMRVRTTSDPGPFARRGAPPSSSSRLRCRRCSRPRTAPPCRLDSRMSIRAPGKLALSYSQRSTGAPSRLRRPCHGAPQLK